MTLDEPEVGDMIFTHAFLAPDQKFTDERYQGVSTASFDGLMAIPDLGLTYELSFKAKVGFGCLTEIFKEARDRVLLPFPCFRSDVPLYGANSGGPVFDKRGRICGVNCTSFAGEAISFHMPLKGILELGARDIEFVPEDPVPRWRTVAELGLARRVPFYPSLERIFFYPVATPYIALLPCNFGYKQLDTLVVIWTTFGIANSRCALSPYIISGSDALCWIKTTALTRLSFFS
jgi:hypothetical protein